MRRCALASILAIHLFAPSTAGAQPDRLAEISAELRRLSQTVRELSAVVERQQRQIEAISGAKSAITSVQPSGAPPATPPPAGARTISSSQYLPDIGLVGDIVAFSSESHEDEEGNDRVSVRELELVLGHDVDPFTRFDATIAFSDEEEAAVEEAYISQFGLPFELAGRLGRFRPKVGIAASQHRDSLDTVDEPLVVQRLFGPEGYSRSGLELSRIFAGFSDSLTHEIWLGGLEGSSEEGELFGETRRRPTLYGRLRNSLDLSERSRLDLGVSFLAGSADEDSSFEARAVGFDLSYARRFDSARKLKLLSEAYLQDRSSATAQADDGAGFRENPVGFYALADLRFAERWGAGLRFDRAQAVDVFEDDERSAEQAYSAYLAFYQSEFARFRLQYQALRDLSGEIDNRLFFQSTVAIGTHKHELQ